MDSATTLGIQLCFHSQNMHEKATDMKRLNKYLWDNRETVRGFARKSGYGPSAISKYKLVDDRGQEKIYVDDSDPSDIKMIRKNITLEVPKR